MRKCRNCRIQMSKYEFIKFRFPLDRNPTCAHTLFPNDGGGSSVVDCYEVKGMFSRRKPKKLRKVKMIKSGESSPKAADTADAAALRVVQWLRSEEGQTRSRETFHETERLLQAY